MNKALLWEKLRGESVQCRLCGHRCKVKPGKYGICGVRKNEDGILCSTNYSRLIAQNVDPIEKKPLFHFFPGSRSMSIASAGCNFQCDFCQNHTISQLKGEGIGVSGELVEPKEAISEAVRNRCKSISYTYTEPTVYFEYVYECSKLAKADGIYNVWVTNGFMTPETIEMISPYMDAANVDLKSFKKETYRKVMRGKLEVVLESIQLLRKKGVWVEVTTLVVPGMNDTDKELKDIAKFLVQTDPDIPWHVSRYHPDYKYSDRNDPTPPKTLNKACEIGYEAGLRYVYCGNLLGVKGEHTFCHSCKELLIERYGFNVVQNRMIDGKCFNCKTKIPGIWSDQ
jgi:pyruvate formate lyase activating enzyme